MGGDAGECVASAKFRSFSLHLHLQFAVSRGSASYTHVLSAYCCNRTYLRVRVCINMWSSCTTRTTPSLSSLSLSLSSPLPFLNPRFGLAPLRLDENDWLRPLPLPRHIVLIERPPAVLTR